MIYCSFVVDFLTDLKKTKSSFWAIIFHLQTHDLEPKWQRWLSNISMPTAKVKQQELQKPKPPVAKREEFASHISTFAPR
jgi:hypothetical protein